MGEVYRARDPRLGRDIAIKVLPERLASSPERLARFEREAKAVASLNHPNIVTLYSIEEAAGTRFLTMELVEGRNLTSLVTPGGLPLGQMLDLSIPLADALVAAHEKGVVHRDLKPANVMVTREGRVKVLDFGLAKLTQPEPDLALSQAATMGAPLSEVGQVVGTAPYMAPEQIRGEAVDVRTDLFSFGVLIYELATGRRPFTGQTFADVSSTILRDDPPALTSIRSDLPGDLERIVCRCLAKQPHERFQTALDLANELRGLKRVLERGVAPAQKASGKVASIAVLPFMNRSASADDEYFSDGLADELLNLLAKIKGLRVTARTSSFSYKGKNTTIAQVGKELDVATVLEGSVRKSGNRVRISVQLVQVSTSSHLWSESYDRTLEDIFAVQDDIAQCVVKELRATLLGEEADSRASGEVRSEVARAAKGRATNPEAHRLYLQGRHLFERSARADVAKAIEYLKQALALEPEFAHAWATLGGAYAREADLGWVPVTEGYGRAREAVERARTLEPNLAEGHVGMAWIQMLHERDWGGAEASLRSALDQAPGDTQALRRMGMLIMNQGRVGESIEMYRRAIEQDPLSPATYHSLGIALNVLGRHAEAEAASRKALELAPQRAGMRASLALTLLAQDRQEEALTEVALEPEELWRLHALAIIRHVVGDRDKSDEALQQLIESHAQGAAYQIAEVCAIRGEGDAAFAWLERAYAQRDGGVVFAKSSRFLGPLHGDPRWSALLTKLGLEV
jgi:serine/threonine protein kinase/Flp pilus assembly protein TadD